MNNQQKTKIDVVLHRIKKHYIYSQISTQPVILRILSFLLTLLLLWLPLTIPIYLLLKNDPNLVTILTMGWLFITFLILQIFWNKYVYQQPYFFKKYGLVWTRKNSLDLLKGLAIGFCFCWGLFILQALLGWVIINPAKIYLLKVIIEGLLSAIGIGLAEELIFRGWILEELKQDYSRQTALWVNSLLFAIAHFIKPLEEIIRTFVTFPALVILGLSLIWAKWTYGNRLGICIGLHAGLVWGYYILNVGQMVEYTGKVPPWITGIDGNPIAGIMGLVFLSALAAWMRSQLSVISDQ
jgi:hypothetical protein